MWTMAMLFNLTQTVVYAIQFNSNLLNLGGQKSIETKF